jgi:hypothetical protein
MESHLGDVVRMGEIAAMMSTRTRGCSYSPPRTLTKCCRNSDGATTPWTSRYEAPAPIGQEAQPAAANSTCQTVEAVEKKVRLKRRTFEPSFSWLVPKIASYGFC